MPVLTDGSVVLRPPTHDDAPAVAAAVRASWPELAPWMPWATEDYDDDAARFWIDQAGTHPFVVLDSGGSVVGTCGLNGLDPVNRRANLGYWVRSDRAGRGVATAATRLVAAHGLGELGLVRLEIVMSVENHASRRVAERAGAAYEGVQRARLVIGDRVHDAHLYAVTADWLSSR